MVAKLEPHTVLAIILFCELLSGKTTYAVSKGENILLKKETKKCLGLCLTTVKTVEIHSRNREGSLSQNTDHPSMAGRKKRICLLVREMCGYFLQKCLDFASEIIRTAAASHGIRN